jgi:hypothetical protein
MGDEHGDNVELLTDMVEGLSIRKTQMLNKTGHTSYRKHYWALFLAFFGADDEKCKTLYINIYGTFLLVSVIVIYIFLIFWLPLIIIRSMIAKGSLPCYRYGYKETQTKYCSPDYENGVYLEYTALHFVKYITSSLSVFTCLTILCLWYCHSCNNIKKNEILRKEIMEEDAT